MEDLSLFVALGTYFFIRTVTNYVHETRSAGKTTKEKGRITAISEHPQYRLVVTFFDSYGESPPEQLQKSLFKTLEKQQSQSTQFADIEFKYFIKQVQDEDGQCGMFTIMFIENMLYDTFQPDHFTDQKMKMLRSIIFSRSQKSNTGKCAPHSLPDALFTVLRDIRDSSNSLEEYEQRVQTQLPNVTCSMNKPKYTYSKDEEWLSNKDIDNVLRQYEKVDDLGFKYFDAVGIDAGKPNCYSSELCALNIDELLEKNKKQFAIVYNTDKHFSSGQHWIGVHGKIEKI